ncbi:unnamed protein product [Sphagnum jensenii]|uniref:Uncharacterized protein n=1 Tax=Sphagnum jensenii TaxID=128206 RepID=A0ABP1B6D3_9BRYO
MSVMASAIVRELGMMHLVTGSKTYKTASGVVTQALGMIDERMNSEALTQESTTIWKNTSTNNDSDWIPDQDRTSMTKENVASTSNSDTGTDGNEHCDSVPNQLEQIDCEDEFRDAELEELVRSEGPQEILQLILPEQVDGFMNEEITDADDYVDWMRWVSDAEQSRRAMCECTHDVVVTLLLQQPSLRDISSIPALLQVVQMKDGDFDRSTTELLGSSRP